VQRWQQLQPSAPLASLWRPGRFGRSSSAGSRARHSELLSSFTTSRAVTLRAGGGTFDTNGNNATLAGLIGGTGGLAKVGAGTLTLSDANSYSGGTSLDGGTLDLAALGAAGTKTITFAKGSEILKIENAALSADTFSNSINSFGVGDVIDLPGLAFATGATASFNNRTHKLAVTSNGVTDTLTLTNPEFTKFVAISDGGGGTEIELVAHVALLTQYMAAGLHDARDSGTGTLLTYSPSAQTNEAILTTPQHT
jgi:autotransporter-associated beta strand protein